MAQTDQLQREAEATRRQLAATLAELRERLAPAAIRRDILRGARRSTAGRFAANLGADATNNAVPLAGIAAGMAWVALTKRRGRGASPPLGSAAYVRDAAGRVSEASSAAMASTRAAGDEVQQRPAQAAQMTKRSSRNAIDRASAAAKQATVTAGTAYTLARNDPLFAAGLGLAVAGVAAALFGWCRKPVSGQAVSDLAAAAKMERASHPKPALVRIDGRETPIIPEAQPLAGNYGSDRTGAERQPHLSR